MKKYIICKFEDLGDFNCIETIAKDGTPILKGRFEKHIYKNKKDCHEFINDNSNIEII